MAAFRAGCTSAGAGGCAAAATLNAPARSKALNAILAVLISHLVDAAALRAARWGGAAAWMKVKPAPGRAAEAGASGGISRKKRADARRRSASLGLSQRKLLNDIGL